MWGSLVRFFKDVFFPTYSEYPAVSEQSSVSKEEDNHDPLGDESFREVASEEVLKQVSIPPMLISDTIPIVTYEQRCQELVREAMKWLGVRETGPNSGPEVEMFQKAVDGVANGEPWCAAFVMFCVGQVDRRLGGNTSPLFRSEHVLTMWNRSDKSLKMSSTIHPGQIIVWQHYKNGVATSSGHCGIVVEVGDDWVRTVEGNTSDRSLVEREGDGVFLLKRRKSVTGNMKVKGYLKCWDDQL